MDVRRSLMLNPHTGRIVITPMNHLMQLLKKAAVFMIGGLLIAVGWHADAQTVNDKGKKTDDTEKKNNAKKAGKKAPKKTSLEKKRPENSSGSK